MRRTAGRITLGLLAAACGFATAQEWELPALPSSFCFEDTRSDPVASYRVSGQCGLTNITVLGEYTDGTAEVLEEIRGFRTQSVERVLVDGKPTYYREVRIELHRLLEPTATLVCRLEMMRPVVVTARIERPAEIQGRAVYKIIESLAINAGRLPDLGVYTHGKSLGSCELAIPQSNVQ